MAIVREQDTIAAIATALSPSGIGIVRISGPEALAVADRVFRKGKARKIKVIQTMPVRRKAAKTVMRTAVTAAVSVQQPKTEMQTAVATAAVSATMRATRYTTDISATRRAGVRSTRC